MAREEQTQSGRILKIAALIVLYGICLIIIAFSLMSGADPENEGWYSIVENSPNTIPWIILLALVIPAHKNELLSGIAIVIYAVALFIFFVAMSSKLYVAVVILIGLIALGGTGLILAGKRKSK